MAKIFKLIIPLLSSEITKNDLTEKAGFVSAFDSDKNRPDIEDCVFLMYKTAIRTQLQRDRHSKFRNLGCLHSWRTIRVGGKSYTLYALKVINKEAKMLLKDRNPNLTSKENIYKTLLFWKGDVEVLKHLILGEKWDKVAIQNVPEEDYTQTMDDIYMLSKNKEGGLS